MLRSVPSATKLDLDEDWTQSKNSTQLWKVKVHFMTGPPIPFFVKLFSDYQKGWSESVMVEKIEQFEPAGAAGKLKPASHGNCVLSVNPHDGSVLQVGYFALQPYGGVTVHHLREDLNWPLESFCKSVHTILQSYAKTDPIESEYPFYHGDANTANFLVDVKQKQLWMIDFGMSYFRYAKKGAPKCITPREQPNKFMAFCSTLTTPPPALTSIIERERSSLGTFI